MITSVDKLNRPEEIIIGDKTFYTTLIPVWESQPLATEILKSNLLGLPQDIVKKLLSYVYVDLGGQCIALDNPVMINQHLKSGKDIYTLQIEVIKRNFDFLFDGSLQKLLEGVFQQVMNTTETSEPSVGI